MSNHPKAIVLLSGGLDSTTCLAIAKNNGFLPLTLSFRYGQRHIHELKAASYVAKTLGVVRHTVIDVDLRLFGNSALTADFAVPKNREIISTDIPITYVPARNTIFLSFALALAETEQVQDIYIGVNAIDYSGYPDCRSDFIVAFEKMANLAIKMTAVDGRHLTIHTPLIGLSKAEIIKTGIKLGVDYTLTTSCYDPTLDGLSCGHCDACRLRLNGFTEAGLIDPAKYIKKT
ncbi:MAG: 7-cyano-7-deazaguanine synthase QueC [Rhodospirillaceae bacterium]|jgi:7-cyano-7-deazaguanine synthase|nr:7-cyano-7-deazaguanine synthase QueC [Rhodospirillaceae bacterium]